MINSIVAGNWKMNKTPSEGKIFIDKMISDIGSLADTNVIICPPFTGLTSLPKSSKYNLGAQNCYFEDSGAYTGEVSVEMLIDCGVKYVILGHSERRSIFNEHDVSIGKKVKKVLDAGITPILCIGETIDQLNEGLAKETVSAQLNKGLNVISSLRNIIIAYEPVWAIGTGLTASVEKVAEIHLLIRSVLSDIFNKQESDLVPILYGGSVNFDNAEELIDVENVNGFLIGGASLDVESFLDIVKIVDKK
tara:strand:+ start:37 stop:783 length:747 start_codon:yes stop_codon:yes gene_type:complete